MKKEDLVGFIGCHVKVVLRNNFVFNGILKEVTDTSILVLDKENEEVTISTDEIMFVKKREEQNGNKH